MTRQPSLQRLEQTFLGDGPILGRLVAAKELERRPDGVDVLLRVATDPACGSWARTHAIQVLPPEHPRTTEVLRGLLADPTPEIRAYAVHAVQGGGLWSALRPDVERLLTDDAVLSVWSPAEERVSDWARDALRTLEPPAPPVAPAETPVDEFFPEKRDAVLELIRGSSLSDHERMHQLNSASQPADSWQRLKADVVGNMTSVLELVDVSDDDARELRRLVRILRAMP